MSKGQESFGEHIRNLRTKLGYSTRMVEIKTAQLPREQRISASYLVQVERGTVPPPSPDKLRGLARVYGVLHHNLMVKAGHISAELKPEELPDFHTYVTLKFEDDPILRKALESAYETVMSVRKGEGERLRRVAERQKEYLEGLES